MTAGTDSLYVVGGTQRKDAADRPQWQRYSGALVVRVDIETGEVHRSLDYQSPPEAGPDEGNSVTFKAATIDGDRLLVPTTTEILIYRLPDFVQTGYVSLPVFNDLHHVIPGANNTLYVASTGLDMVFHLTENGEQLNEWSAADELPWSRFSREIDYRKIGSIKPHLSHPNFLFELDSDLWVTRCDSCDAVCLTDDHPKIDLGGSANPHDGILVNGNIYFTLVDGTLVIVDQETRRVTRSINLGKLVGTNHPLGWCRGVEILSEDVAVVGFSRLRSTPWGHKIRWTKRLLGGSGHWLYPTRIAAFDIRRDKMLWELDLEPYEMNAVFSIHRVPLF